MKTVFHFFFAFLFYSFLSYAGETVIRYEGTQPLNERWKWASQQGANLKEEFWVAYSFDRLMYQNESIGSWYGDHQKRTTLLEIIEGQPMPTPPHISGRGSLITKQVAILFEYKGNSSSLFAIPNAGA